MSQESDVFRTPVAKVLLQHIVGVRQILDIGRGGEGLISRLEENRVCAVDLLLNKIREARIYSLRSHWIQEDARAPGIRDGMFDGVIIAYLNFKPMIVQYNRYMYQRIEETGKI